MSTPILQQSIAFNYITTQHSWFAIKLLLGAIKNKNNKPCQYDIVKKVIHHQSPIPQINYNNAGVCADHEMGTMHIAEDIIVECFCIFIHSLLSS